MADSNTPPDNNGSGSSSNSNQLKQSVAKQLANIQDQMAENPRPDKDEPVEVHREYKKLMNGLSKQALALRKQQIDDDPKLSDDEKDVLRLYEKGVQIYSIAAQIYKFANQQTVGLVVNIIRKAHADDFDEVEDVNSTKGYTGIGAGTSA